MKEFNYHMLCLARNARGFTQAEFSKQANIGQGTQSKYETGLASPPEEYVDEASRILKYHKSFFYHPGRPYGFPPFHFRKRKKLSAKVLDKVVAQMNVRRMHIGKLLVAIENRPHQFIPEIDRDEYRGVSRGPASIEEIATHVRELWGVPSGPIDNMVDLLESRGAVVIPCDFGTDLLDAMSQRIDGMPVLFFVNMYAPADRVRHTLAHELGHMVLHTLALSDDDAMEDEADSFAGAFLLPAKEIKPQLRRFDLRQLANLKAYWKVSMAALAVRADRLNLITPHQKKMFWIEMGRLGYRKREPKEPPHEPPKSIPKMIRFHLEHLQYSPADLSAMLDIYIDEFNELYLSSSEERKKPKLMIVK